MSKIPEENPTLMEEEFKKFKDTCATEEAKLKSELFKGLQKRYRGTIASKAVVTLERCPNGIRMTQYVKPRGSQTPSRSSPTRWSVTSSGPGTSGTRKKKVFYTDQITRKLIRLLVIILLAPYI